MNTTNPSRPLRMLFAISLISLAGACMMDDDDATDGDRSPAECTRPDDASAGPGGDSGPRAPRDTGSTGPRLSPPARIELLAIGAEKYRGKAVVQTEQRKGDAVRVTFDTFDRPA
jgi:hypothetical protein